MNKIDETFIQDRITQLRLDKGVSEYQMSLDLGKSKSYIQGISSGRALPSMKQFLEICDYFELTPLEFFRTDLSNPGLIRTATLLLEKLNEEDILLIMNLMRRMQK